MIKDESFDEQGELTDDFLKGTGLSRLIGWTIFSPALLTTRKDESETVLSTSTPSPSGMTRTFTAFELLFICVIDQFIHLS